MKKVLILGANSYIGNSFQKYIGENYNDQYEVHKVSLRGEAWKEDDWSGYDSILNVTGKAHADIGILTEEQKQEYYAVNCDLACEAAQKAVKDGVGQYIYLSSVIVYGDSSNGGGAIHITKDTKRQIFMGTASGRLSRNYRYCLRSLRKMMEKTILHLQSSVRR